MTRFIMQMNDAIDLVLFAFKNANSGDIFIKKSSSATINTIVESMKLIFGSKKIKTKFIGIRHGEKLHETLMSREEKNKSRSFSKYFSIPYDNRDLNYDRYYDHGQKVNLQEDYTSETVKQLKQTPFVSVYMDVCATIQEHTSEQS
jgi:UDP-glucose 4-epimerase